MTFGGGDGIWKHIRDLQQSEVDALVGAALEQDINFLDTADVYSAGRSEIVTGQALRNLRVPRDQFVLATKVLGRFSRESARGWSPVRQIAREHSASVARVAIAWLLHQPHVTSVIIGAKRRDQLDDNIAATELKLSADELAKLDKVSALIPEYPGWMLERLSADRAALVK